MPPDLPFPNNPGLTRRGYFLARHKFDERAKDPCTIVFATQKPGLSENTGLLYGMLIDAPADWNVCPT